jgi:hypothetical protein
MLQASVDAQQHIMALTKRPDLLTVPQAAKLLGKPSRWKAFEQPSNAAA